MIFILTGAGISRESGLETFRDADGLWANERVEDVATPGGFARNPKKVYDFYNQRRRQLTTGDVNPNAAHLALARLEAEYPRKHWWSPKMLMTCTNAPEAAICCTCTVNSSRPAARAAAAFLTGVMIWGQMIHAPVAANQPSCGRI